MNNSKIIIGIPGLWQTRSDIVCTIAEKSEGFLFAGNILKNLEQTNEYYEVDVYEHDEKLYNAFKIAGRGEFSIEQLDSIRKISICIIYNC